MNKKIKLLRVVTQAEVVPWHLKNFIVRAFEDYDLYITGNGVSKYKDDYPYVRFIDNDIHRKISFFYDLKALFKLIKTCREIKPQIIHSIMPKSGLIAAIAGKIVSVPVRIHTYTGQVWSTKTGVSRKILSLIDKVALVLNTACLTDSPSQSAFLEENGFSKNNKPIPFLNKGSLTGVDLKLYDANLVNNRKELRKKLGIEEGDFVFGFFARKSISKGIEFLLESFANIAEEKNFKLLMVGVDESNGRLAELLKKFNNIEKQIINLDQAPKHEEYLSIIDVLCSPSSSEGFGSIVIEAAAMGIPTVGFKVLGLIDSVVDNHSGLLVPYGDVPKYSEAMRLLFDEKLEFSLMRDYAKERIIKHFSADVMYACQNEFYKKLLIKMA